MWLGQAVSVLGDEVLDTSIILWLALAAAGGESWGPAAVAGALAARNAPILLFGLIGGVYTDRWDPRRTMLVMDAIRGVLIGALAILLLVGAHLPIGVQLTGIYTVLVLCALATVFFNPARYCVLAAVVADADRERMGSITAGTTALSTIVGPSLAAMMLVFANVQWSLLVTALGFVVSFVAVAKVRVPRLPVGAASDEQCAGMWRDLVSGLRFFAASHVLRVMLVVTGMTIAGVATINTLGVFFVAENLHAPPQTYGILGTAFGVGSLIGAVLSAIFAGRFHATRIYAYGFALAGVLLIGFSQMSTPWGAIILLCLTGIPIAAVNSMMGPMLMRATPQHFLGRATAVLLIATRLAGLLSVTTAAWLATTVLSDLDAGFAGLHFGTIDTIFLATGAIIVVVGVWAARSLRTETGAGGQPAGAPDDQEAAPPTPSSRPPAGRGRWRRPAPRAPLRRRSRRRSRSGTPMA